MSWAKLFHSLWLADWSSVEIAEAYGTNEERVRILVASFWADLLPEEEAA
jgi:hypothetical protein